MRFLLVAAVLTFSEGEVLRVGRGQYKTLANDAKQCKTCGFYSFCNFVVLPLPNSGKIKEGQSFEFEKGEFYSEMGEDACRCKDVPDTTLTKGKKDTLCNQFIDQCNYESKVQCRSDYKCISTTSTYYCNCQVKSTNTLFGQHCEYQTSFSNKRKTHHPPLLLNLLRLPRDVKVEVAGNFEKFVPSLYFAIRPKKSVFILVYIYGGRFVEVVQSDVAQMIYYAGVTDFELPLLTIYNLMPMAIDYGSARAMSAQNEAFPLKGSQAAIYAHCIFLDVRMRIELDAPDNVIPNNKDYKWRSVGRIAKLHIIVGSKPDNMWLATHAWINLRIFVPYEKHFLPCSYKITISVKGVKCSGNEVKPTLVFIKNPVTLTASRERWFESATCHMSVTEHRWQLIKTRRLSTADDEKSTSSEHLHTTEHVLPLSKKWSSSASKSFYEEHFLKAAKARYQQSKLWLVIYDLVQTGHPDVHASGHNFQSRKLCFLSVVDKDTELTVYPVEREKTVTCDKTHTVEIVNDNPATFPNQDIEVEWTCVDSDKKPCKRLVTTGVNPYETEKLVCKKIYTIRLSITFLKNHPDKISKFDQVTLHSEPAPTEVKIVCHGNCPHTFNKGSHVSLSAAENPETGSPWIWEIFYAEDTEKSVKYIKLSDAEVARLRKPNTESHVFIMEVMNELKKDRYTISAKTERGKDSYSLVVNQGPSVGSCGISPTSGKMGEPIFTVSCQNWGKTGAFLPLVYRVVEEYPLSTYPVVSSLDEIMPNLIFYHGNLSVLVTDSRGGFVSYPLRGVKLTSSDMVKEVEFYEYLRRINNHLLGNGNGVALELMGELVRKMKASGTVFEDDWMMDLLSHLERVDPIIETVDIQRALDVMNRMMECKFSPNSLRTDEILNAVSIQFSKISEAVSSMMDGGDYTLHDRDKLIPYMTQGASLILNRRDKIIERDSLEEDDHERHVQLVKRSTVSALESMENMARALERDVAITIDPYSVHIGGLDLLVTVEEMAKLNEEMQKVKDTHTFTFSPETLEKYAGTQLTMTKLSGGSKSAFWFDQDAVSAGIMDIVLSPTVNKSVKITEEPIDVFLKMTNFSASSETMNGILKPPPPCYSQAKSDKSVSVHQLKLPDGEGAVYLRFPGNLVNRIKISTNQSRPPTFEEATGEPVLSQMFHISKFSNYNNTMETDFYIGIIPENVERPPEPYAFNVTIMRCAIWIGERFESRGCKFIELQTTASVDNPVLRCKCSHQSWFSASFFLPPNKIVLSEDLQLFSTILDNFYVPLLVALMLIFLVIVLIWGYRKDRKDLEERNVMPMKDNYPGETYPYIVAVFTGERFGSGTSSRVALRIVGERGYSRVHILSSDKRQVLGLGSDDWFLLNTAKSLGKIQAIQLWHNHTGSRPEWYCRRVVIYDITVDKEYEFVIERWFTFDGSVPAEEARMYEGKLATEDEKSQKWYFLITGWAYSELREKHHWASIFTRHPRSLYTRCQRAMIAVGLVMSIMLVSMMFFDITSVGPADLPAAGFSFTELWISIKSALISIVLTMAIVFFFQKSKKKDEAEINELRKEKNKPTEEVKKLTGKKKFIGLWKKVLAMGLKPKPIPYKSVTYNEEKKKKSLGSKIFLVIAWTLSSTTLLIESFFLVLYGLKFGPKKSLVWLMTFMSGSITSTFIIEPIKMVVLAILISLLFKKSNIDSFTMQINYTVTQDESPRSKILQLKEYYKVRMESQYHPSLTIWIQSQSSARFRSRSVRYLTVYGVFYVLMLGIVGCFLAFIQIQIKHYSVRQIAYHFQETTTHPMFEDAEHLISKESMYNFLHRSAIPSLHRVLWYNNRSLPLETGEKEPRSDQPRFASDVKGWFQGYANKLLGVPRLRQLRLAKDDWGVPPVFFGQYFERALGRYKSGLADKKAYLPTWKEYDKKRGKLNQLWIYTPPFDTGSVFGKSFALYDGGGYFYLLDWNLGGSLRKLQYLEMNEYVNNLTRCLFLEINLYNNNLKLFTTVRLINEALPNGFYSFRPQFETASLLFKTKPDAQAVVILMGILAVVLVGYALFCFVQFSRIGFFNYFATFRGFCDVVLLTLGLVAISSFFQRALHFSLFVEYLDNSPHDKYVSLFTPFLTDEKADNVFGAFTMMLAVCMGVNSIQLISIGRFRWVFNNVVSLLVIVVFLNTLFNGLLSGLSLSIDREFYDLFVFQFTFKQEKLGTYQVDENRIFFVMVTPIVIGMLKFNLAGVIYYYNTLEEKRRTALAIFHGKREIKRQRRTRRKFNKDLDDRALKGKIDRILV